MNGQDLLEAMSFLDEELVAASDAPARVFPWKQAVSLAACFCVLLLGTFAFLRFANQGKSNASEAVAFTAAAPQDSGQPETAAAGASNEVLKDACSTEAPSILVRLEELTETGFRGTVLEDGSDWNQGDSLLIEYAEGFLPDPLTPGTEYRIWAKSFDPQTHCAIIFQMEPVG